MRAIERTYNLLQQVSGRAGRSKKQGKVFIQTYYPKQPVIQSLQKRDRKKFVEQSLKDREDFLIPPFGFMTALILSGSSKTKTEMYGRKIDSIYKNTRKFKYFRPSRSSYFFIKRSI